MDTQIKLTSWNAEWLDKLYDNPTDPKKMKRLKAVCEEILEMNPDIFCLIEGPKGEQRIDDFCTKYLEGKYQAVKLADGKYRQQGRQWIWFLIKSEFASQASILSTEVWDNYTEANWDVNYWGDFEVNRHEHYRHPQVLIYDWKSPAGDLRIEIIGLHTKSKFVNGGEKDWNLGGEKRKEFIKGAIKARIKMTTEVANVRKYIDKKFEQISNPAIIVLGDLNDGPGKEYIENQYIFFDLLSNLQGDIFSSKKYLNHALFDFDESLRWTCYFEDFIDKDRNPKILLDHIMFTQGMVDGTLPALIEAKSGFVEHEIHDHINAIIPKYARTSDHKPVSLIIRNNPKI